jgi:hypothetical protein
MTLGLRGSVAAQSAGDFKNVGVYAVTDHGVTVLTTYGFPHGKWKFDMADVSVPQAQSVAYFVVNMPEGRPDRTAIYSVRQMPVGNFVYLDLEKQECLDVNIEPMQGGIYKYSSPVLKNSTGYLCLRVSMPPGISDRLYCVALASSR